MDKHLLLLEAAPAFLAVVDRVEPADLDRPTPCADWDVRALCAHLLEWGPPLEGAARKESVPPGAAYDTLKAQAERLAEAWGTAAAWEGATVMGTFEMPADLVGGMVLGEFALHGWDLARALDVPIAFSDGVAHLVYAEVARSAAQGREMGVYGPEIAVADGAPVFERALALSGRDPFWKAS
ncbi:TIGR03086 family metal-binding protein [Dactylosporangium sp. CS-033363]|uniref:TIGR03086 family metal-binding protein n=1 Tax=Dactylosporangium sp. CS-033363 TaxID=3239935 RepID=UPI003D8B6450